MRLGNEWDGRGRRLLVAVASGFASLGAWVSAVCGHGAGRYKAELFGEGHWLVRLGKERKTTYPRPDSRLCRAGKLELRQPL